MLEAVHKGVLGVAASDVRHGADGLWVVEPLSRVVVDPVLWYPGWWFRGVQDPGQVIKTVAIRVGDGRTIHSMRVPM